MTHTHKGTAVSSPHPQRPLSNIAPAKTLFNLQAVQLDVSLQSATCQVWENIINSVNSRHLHCLDVRVAHIT